MTVQATTGGAAVVLGVTTSAAGGQVESLQSANLADVGGQLARTGASGTAELVALGAVLVFGGWLLHGLAKRHGGLQQFRARTAEARTNLADADRSPPAAPAALTGDELATVIWERTIPATTAAAPNPAVIVALEYLVPVAACEVAREEFAQVTAQVPDVSPADVAPRGDPSPPPETAEPGRTPSRCRRREETRGPVPLCRRRSTVEVRSGPPKVPSPAPPAPWEGRLTAPQGLPAPPEGAQRPRPSRWGWLPPDRACPDPHRGVAAGAARAGSRGPPGRGRATAAA